MFFKSLSLDFDMHNLFNFFLYMCDMFRAPDDALCCASQFEKMTKKIKALEFLTGATKDDE